MRVRRVRAEIATGALVIAAFVSADLVGYGSEQGYHTDLALGYLAGLVAIAVALFSWNVVTYKR
jgi:hypothetical protein